MKVCLYSDLHLELQELTFAIPEADLYIFAGDISYASNVMEVIRKVIPKGEVLFTPGNHEFYRHECGMIHAKRHMAAQAQIHDIKTLIHPGDHHIIGDKVFIGGTLWTDLLWKPAALRYLSEAQISTCVAGFLNDYRLITTNDEGTLLTTSDVKLEFKKTIHGMRVNYLKYMDTHEIIVVTHMAPSDMSSLQMYKGTPSTAAYVSSLENWILERPKIKYWFHGHVHNCVDYEIGDCRVYANPFGYMNENAGNFNPKFLIEI